MFTGVIAPNIPHLKWAQLGAKTKNEVLLLGKVENGKYTETETKHPERVEECYYFRLSEISDNPLAQPQGAI